MAVEFLTVEVILDMNNISVILRMFVHMSPKSEFLKGKTKGSFTFTSHWESYHVFDEDVRHTG